MSAARPIALALAAALAASAAAPGAARAQVPDAGPPSLQVDEVAGGRHWRIVASRGVVHVWRPPGYQPETAGIVVYVHGYYTDVDRAFAQHQLPRQLTASRRNALLIMPAAPGGDGNRVAWPDLGELLRAVRAATDLERPPGPIVVVAHSGGYRTLGRWLDGAEVDVDHAILVDALYGYEEELLGWLDGDDRRTLTLVILSTLRWGEPLLHRRADAAVRDGLPRRVEGFTGAERRARLLYVRSQLGHMELVTGGAALPVLLARTPLPEVAAPL